MRIADARVPELPAEATGFALGVRALLDFLQRLPEYPS
jgi:hypothetical protein